MLSNNFLSYSNFQDAICSDAKKVALEVFPVGVCLNSGASDYVVLRDCSGTSRQHHDVSII